MVVVENGPAGVANSVDFVLTPNTNGVFSSKLPLDIAGGGCVPNVIPGAGGSVILVLERGFLKIPEVGAGEDVVNNPTAGAVGVAEVAEGAHSPPKVLLVGPEGNELASATTDFRKLLRGVRSDWAGKVSETEAS